MSLPSRCVVLRNPDHKQLAARRLGREQAQLLHHFIEVGEYGLALEKMGLST